LQPTAVSAFGWFAVLPFGAGRHCWSANSDGGSPLPWYSLINGVGVLIATGYSGYITSADRIPWAGFLSVVIYIAGFVLPLIAEHHRLGSGFDRIEADFRANRRREVDPPRQEILTTAIPAEFQNRRGSSFLAVFLCALCATALLGFDIIELIINMPVSEMPSDRISNF
jgi:hypothetical protein